jgi:hypothetical protein
MANLVRKIDTALSFGLLVGAAYSVLKMTIKTKSMMRRRVNRAGPSGLV